MLKFDQVLHARLGSLKEAVTDWSETVTKLEKAQEKADNGLRSKAEKADWAGENAGVTQAFVKKTAKEFGDALKEATSIRNVLRDAHTEFQGAKSDLEKLVESAPGKGIRIDSDGVVSYLIHPDRRSKDYDGPKPEKADFDAMRASIKAAIDKANEADDVAARALRTLVGKNQRDFSGTSYDGLKEASKAQDAEDAKTAYDLYKKGDDASPAEIDKLNKLFKDNADDRYFAERFALEVGPKGSMEYWADMGDPSDGSRLGVDHRDKLSELQKNWSLTLASATHSTSPEMEQWKADVIKAGSEPIQTRGTSPYGFQVMSNLMRVGDYDDKFMTNYGKALVVTEQKMTHNGALPPDRAWMQMGGMQNHLNWQGGGLGNDPMVGFMEGLGHNPKASTDFFNNSIEVPGDDGKNKKLDTFDYFSKDRDWPEELTDKGKMSKEPGYNALGHALESAVTGHPFDAPAEGLKDVRTVENAEVMQKVVERYGSETKYMHEQPGIDDSLGKMGAAYIDELNRSMEQENGSSMQEVTDSPFGANNADGKSRFGDKFDTELLFNRGDAINFMGTVAQSETGHAQLSAAQTIYTTSVMDEVGPKPGSGPARDLDLTDAKTALRIGAETHGILDNSRMAQIDAQYEKDSEEHKKAVGRTTEWVKFGVGAVAAGGVVALTGGAGGVLVPLAAETVGGAVTTFIGMEADDIAEKYQEDELLKKKSDDLKDEALNTGKQNALMPAQAYAEAPGWSRTDSNYINEELTKYVKDSRLHAKDDSLPDPYKPKK
ncbi:hypothetical protein [Streptomyces sp. SP18CS02]|uniref:hypothetical protein n=1 Tax=Streptomyces sp. SP18CS02 TaxID=3002531 RepID=UPI002E78A40A|nr:hypothetical protein [Streptomyces sp. SP18CS02]MEE1752264.1 hypothetical protein [Streptomyces sp. SP18CS02]